MDRLSLDLAPYKYDGRANVSCFAMTASPPATGKELQQFLGTVRRSYSYSLERAFRSGSGPWVSCCSGQFCCCWCQRQIGIRKAR